MIEKQLKLAYQQYLNSDENIFFKIPYIETVKELTTKIPVYKDTVSDLESKLTVPPHNDLTNPPPKAEVLRDINIKQNNKTLENTVQIYQRGLTMNKYGRLRGNMEYLEDSWDIQIQPITFQFAHIINSEIKLTDAKQMKVRDKYLKVRVRYDGTQYALVNAIRTLFTVSYA